MVEAELFEWMTYHRNLFSLNSPEDEAMVLAWGPLLEPYAFADLRNASNWLIINQGGIYRTQQLGALRAHVIAAMEDRQKRQNEANAIETKCSLCGNTGSAIVPHL